MDERRAKKPQHRKKRKKRKVSKLLRFLTVIGAVILIAAAVVGISYAIGKHFANNIMSASSGEITTDVTQPNADSVEVVIPQGASTKQIAEILKEDGLIKSELTFRLKSKINGADGLYNYGTFYLTKGLTAEQIIAALQQTSSADTQNKITIPEGYTVKQIAALVDEKGIATTEEFMNEMNNGTFDYDFLEGITKRDYYLEGYLFPDTYYLSGNETAHDIIVMMLDRFEEIYSKNIKSYVASSGYSLDQLVTVASMVESESQLDSERPTIAGVIYNRLNIDMLLQIDATVQYALATKNEVVTQTDLSVDSPYNTYKYKGLPAGPICNPGLASLEAAVKPETHNYYYYVLKVRGESEHTFAENYEDFLTAKAAYQATFNN
ncbi:MAG: endolytic transglycosylase MltG [Candidatus Metalachnospira sp.]|nr:endolytic transglycosylase MltG [Candidatus Metalachnospira sp.]